MAGLYLHIPFCAQRCVYCDFYFVTTRADHTPFVDALLAEIDRAGAGYGAREPVETIYFGGGTPSRLAPDAVARILEAVAARFDTSGLREVSFELNPDDVDLAYLRAVRGAGVDRLSIGIQSFFEDELRWMNRSHDADAATRIVPLARRAGFENLTIDLIFGLPGQSAERWQANLERAADLDVPHLSTYSLTVEPRTPLARQVDLGRVVPADDDALAGRYRATLAFLRDRGYQHYEVSSFARPGFRSQHNQLYWRHTNYLGLGPAAHSFWRDAATPAVRWAGERSLRRYEEAHRAGDPPPVAFREVLTSEQLADEYVLLRLRTRDGLDLDTLARDYGRDLRARHATEIARLQEAGFLEPLHNAHLRLTDEGLLRCDTVTGMLVR